MGLSIEQMRAGGGSRRGTDALELCLAQHLVARVKALQFERQTVAVQIARTADGDVPSSLKMGQGAQPARVSEIDAELETLYDEMREHTGVLTLEAEPTGEWIRWRDAHPARKDGEDANGRPVLSPIDQTVTWGWCDSSALLDRLGKYAVAWNGEPLKPGEWDWIVDNAVPGDLKEACQRVVALHENVGERAPK
jgi:hypothetical protein